MKTKFYEYLQVFRKLKGYTQAEMAEKLEISRSAYTNYESGNRSPDLETVERISDILDCSLDELFGRIKFANPNMVGETPTTYHTKKGKIEKKKLAVGVQDFRSLREKNGYYVDKTQMIEEFFESGYQVTLITRPRRFGKTLNMSMLAEFFDCTKDSEDIFQGTQISESYMLQEMNEHPVVFLSFLNVKGDTEEEMLYKLASTLQYEYQRLIPILDAGNLSDVQRRVFDQIYEGLSRDSGEIQKKNSISTAIVVLCQTLEEHYGKKVFLLIDEYDTPFISANVGGYYESIRSVLASMLSSSLKGNSSLEKAMLTGIQRVAKENIFSGLNNLTVCTVRDPEYAECFGFTELETRSLLQYYGIKFTDEVRQMYDGYQFATTEVYNPWSVTCYAARRKLESYWVNTSENSILKNALEEREETFSRKYNELIEKGEVSANVELTTAYYEQVSDASLWGLLVNAGMVTIEEELEEDFYKLRIPNYEVRRAFEELTAFSLKIERDHLANMLRCMRVGDMEEFAEEYQRILLSLPSYHDLKSENSYHMMMLGMCAFLYRYYDVKSNRESGTGRSDILLHAKRSEVPHIILEFKYTKDESQDLTELAEQAITQIKKKQYDADMTGKVCLVGLAHCGKNTQVRWENLLL